MDPRRLLADDLYIEQLMREGEQLQPLTPDEEVECRRRLEAILAKLSIGGDRRIGTASRELQSFRVETTPIATLAAADVVKISQRFELGTIRLLQSPMRADLAIEVVLDDDRIAAYGNCVFFIGADDEKSPIAVIPNASPVFTGLFAADFNVTRTLSIEATPSNSMDAPQVEAVRRARRSLRDPGDRARYDDVLGRGRE